MSSCSSGRFRPTTGLIWGSQLLWACPSWVQPGEGGWGISSWKKGLGEKLKVGLYVGEGRELLGTVLLFGVGIVVGMGIGR